MARRREAGEIVRVLIIICLAALFVCCFCGCGVSVDHHNDSQKVDINVHHDPQRLDIYGPRARRKEERDNRRLDNELRRNPRQENLQ